MDKSRLLIIGARGQLGLALQTQYPKAKAIDVDELDISSQEAVEQFGWDNTDIIVNAAAYTNVDGAETPEGRVTAWRVNADGVANLVAVAAQKDMVLIHISTDYVFDGTQTPHSETEPFSPLNVYGASKAAGDIAVSLLPKFYIIRTSWVIGEGKNFVRTMLGLGRKGVSPTVVSDQVGRLTFTSELVLGINHLLTTQAPFGTYNLTNDGSPASWAEITRNIFRHAGCRQDIIDTTTSEYFADKPQAAIRPLQSTLDLASIQATGFSSRNWEQDLAVYIKKELQA